MAYLSRCIILAYEVRACAESKILRILFAFSFLHHIMFSFAGHLAGFILVAKVFGKLGGSLRIRWKERVWVVKQDFQATFQGNVTFFCLFVGFFFAFFSRHLDSIVLIIGSPVIISVFSHLCRKTDTQGGKTQGLQPRDNVLMTCFIQFSLAQKCFLPRPLTPFYGNVN